ncbi:MAG: hypothetical protein AB7T49_06705 [Oligoflexales bacterium]
MKLKKRPSQSNVTPDLLDSLHNLWVDFSSGFNYLSGEYDDPVVNCPSCDENYHRRNRKQAFCDECRPSRKRRTQGLYPAYV